MSSDPKRMLEQEREMRLPHDPQVRWLFKLLRDDATERLEEIIETWAAMDRTS